MNCFTRQSDWMKIRATINKHLQNAANELGINIPPVKNIAFTQNSFRTKVECFAKVDTTVNSISGETVSTPAQTPDQIEKMMWDQNSPYFSAYGLKASDYGRKFTAGGEWYTVCGLKPRNHKLPIIGKRADGKRFKFTTRVLSVMA